MLEWRQVGCVSTKIPSLHPKSDHMCAVSASQQYGRHLRQSRILCLRICQLRRISLSGSSSSGLCHYHSSSFDLRNSSFPSRSSRRIAASEWSAWVSSSIPSLWWCLTFLVIWSLSVAKGVGPVFSAGSTIPSESRWNSSWLMMSGVNQMLGGIAGKSKSADLKWWAELMIVSWNYEWIGFLQICEITETLRPGIGHLGMGCWNPGMIQLALLRLKVVADF